MLQPYVTIDTLCFLANPQRTCAVRVTVLVLCMCMYVFCVSVLPELICGLALVDV